MRSLTRLLSPFLLLLLVSLPLMAQESSEEKLDRILVELSEMRAELADIRKDNTDLKQRLSAMASGLSDVRQKIQTLNTAPAAQAQPAPPQIVKPLSGQVDISGAPTKGGDGARVAVIEFSDFECPYCSRYAMTTYSQVQEEYVDSGKVKYVFMDLPLVSIHRNAFKAAEAGMCAGEQDKFWEMHDELFANQRSITPFSKHAETLGLEMDAFNECLSSGRHAGAIRQDIQTAAGFGIRGTPTFALGLTEDGGKTVKLVKMFSGARPFSLFQQEIDSLLEEAAGD